MPKLLKIITHPNDILKKKSQKISQEVIKSKEFQTLCDDMFETMIKKDGIGLAAPQIGKNICLSVINSKQESLYIINPRIIKKSWSKEWGEEGCLSVPNVFGKVKRHSKITCIYTDRNGKEIRISPKGLMARVFQHEIDHLDGILFIEKAKNIKTQKLRD
ncbi:peptide deformylase [Candidatus Parcubacteria bacterium]|nr:peptide deformylase [Candidatus Parcubacteria bacterium]